jgi:hypothetical protein
LVVPLSPWHQNAQAPVHWLLREPQNPKKPLGRAIADNALKTPNDPLPSGADPATTKAPQQIHIGPGNRRQGSPGIAEPRQGSARATKIKSIRIPEN